MRAPTVVPLSSGTVRDLIGVVRGQLPRDLQDKFSVDVQTDAYQLQAVALFRDRAGTVHACVLEALTIAGAQLNCKVPELFLAKLCALAR